MKIIDPTYLRTIHDGLVTGSVNKDNASSLPCGLVGVYEEALPPLSLAADRQKFNEFFAVWALLKKEVSAAFMVPLLAGWTEDQVIGYIAQYSKWFNSPVSGMYVLYHERLRTFVLQKISQDQLSCCNHALIQQSSLALQSKSGDEWERYALEHLSTHLLTAAMGSKDASELKALAYSTAHWNRQIEISKGFEWSKRMLNDMMLWASKYDDDEVIECALNKVDLYHMEQNDAPRIVELVAQNDIETALQRIESFGGNDKEGLQRKFILYMLCLMELTLLDSKDKPFRREAIEKLLRHLDDNLRVDHSMLNWNDFFPSYTMFLMACDWAEMGLDYLIVYKRTDTWETAWLSEKGPFSDSQFKILLECTWDTHSDSEKGRALKDISTELSKQGKLDEATTAMQGALTCVIGISDAREKSLALKDISTELAKLGQIEESIAFAIGISNVSDKISALQKLFIELAKQGKVEEAASAIQEALTCAMSISKKVDKISFLKELSTELAKNGKVEEAESVMQEALTCAMSISDDWEKRRALMAISTELSKQGKFDEALTCARGISSDRAKSSALKDISTELAKQGKVVEAASAMQEALTCARGISDDEEKSRALKDISIELGKQGKVEEAASVIQEALTCARGISDDEEKSSVLKDISTELAKQGKVVEAASAMQEALTCARGISDDEEKSRALSAISTELSNQGKVEEAASAMQEALTCARGISDDRKSGSFSDPRSGALKNICKELSKQGNFDDAIVCAHEIKITTNDHVKVDAIESVIRKMLEQGKIKDAIKCGRGIISEVRRDRLLIRELDDINNKLDIVEKIECARSISDSLKKKNALNKILKKSGKMNDKDLAALMIEVALEFDLSMPEKDIQNIIICITKELAREGKIKIAYTFAQAISSVYVKDRTLLAICYELAEQRKIQEAIEMCKYLTADDRKGQALVAIAAELVKNGNTEDSIEIALGADSETSRSYILQAVSSELVKQGNLELALENAREISDDFLKVSTMMFISTEVAKKGNVNEADKAMQEALACARGISSDWGKSIALKDISTELAKQGKVEEALTCARDISSDKEKSIALLEISTELAKQGKLEEALTCARGISDESHNSSALSAISTELAIQGKVEEALTCARDISDDYCKSSALKDISTELAKQGNWGLAEYISLEIPQMKEKHSCWKTMANNGLHELGSQKAIHNVLCLQSDEARRHYIQGWVEHVDLTDCSKDLFLATRHYYQADSNCLQQMFQKFALRHLFLDESEPDFIQRLNKSLDIQWAMDIRNNLIYPL